MIRTEQNKRLRIVNKVADDFKYEVVLPVADTDFYLIGSKPAGSDADYTLGLDFLLQSYQVQEVY